MEDVSRDGWMIVLHMLRHMLRHGLGQLGQGNSKRLVK